MINWVQNNLVSNRPFLATEWDSGVHTLVIDGPGFVHSVRNTYYSHRPTDWTDLWCGLTPPSGMRVSRRRQPDIVRDFSWMDGVTATAAHNIR